jgi:lysophospholipase L1-like esterase
MQTKTSRRNFLQAGTWAAVAAVTKTDDEMLASFLLSSTKKDKEKQQVFLFQGDSITDGNRGRSKDPNHIMGHGYAFAIASRVGADFAAAGHTFYNRGISGNKITDLSSRWEADTLALAPTVLSILVGINDAAQLLQKQTVEQADIDAFENTYRSLLQQSRQQNAATLLVLCLPFVFPVAKVKDNWDNYRSTVSKLAERIQQLATEFNAVLVNFTPVFTKATSIKSIDYWIWDGIHPTVAGHELMAREWIKQVSKQLGFLKKYKY